jgi:hypothetical protein
MGISTNRFISNFCGESALLIRTCSQSIMLNIQSLYKFRKRPSFAAALGTTLVSLRIIWRNFLRAYRQLPAEREALARARSSTSLFKSRMLPPVNSDDWLCEIIRKVSGEHIRMVNRHN